MFCILCIHLIYVSCCYGVGHWSFDKFMTGTYRYVWFLFYLSNNGFHIILTPTNCFGMPSILILYTGCNHCIRVSNICVFDAAMYKSSTYTANIVMSLSCFLMYKHVSSCNLANVTANNVSCRCEFQFRPLWGRPYSDLISLNTIPGGDSTPSGGSYIWFLLMEH